MSPKLREILDEYCTLEYEKRGSFPVEVPIPFQLYRQVHPVYTWQSRQTRFVMQEESRAYPEPVDAAVQEGIRNGTFAVPTTAADTSLNLPSGVSIAMESSYRIPMDRCGEEGCTVCSGPRVRESRDVPNDMAFFMNTERLGRDVFQRTYEPLPRRRNRRS